MAEPEIKTEFYPNGKLRREIPYINGKKEGIGKVYWENGSLLAEIPYGELKAVEVYENDKLIREFTPEEFEKFESDNQQSENINKSHRRRR